jgi:hypothetical protein
MSAIADSRGLTNNVLEKQLELPNGDSVTVRIDERDDADRLDVEHEHQWSFLVDDGVARLENGPRPLPEWMEPLVRRLGLDGVVR